MRGEQARQLQIRKAGRSSRRVSPSNTVAILTRLTGRIKSDHQDTCADEY